MSKGSKDSHPGKSSVAARVALLVVLLCAAAGGIGYIAWQQWELSQAAERAKQAPAPEASATTAELVDNPIDFASLWETNSESYAWLYMPNCEINAPIQQSSSDDSYYLTHDAAGAESLAGSLFTQLANKRDFSDPVTVIYGHDVDGYLRNLHYFEDAQFFADNPEFYIYTPGHILTYTVVSAYKYDDRHILNSFDFSKSDVREQYFSYVSNPDSLLKNVREGIELNADSKIVQLSTCMLNEFRGSSRYIVTGVLTSDQETK